jgi:hypothetical protein
MIIKAILSGAIDLREYSMLCKKWMEFNNATKIAPGACFLK